MSVRRPAALGLQISNELNCNLRPLYSAKVLECPHDLPRPLPNLLIPQRPLVGLQLRTQQNRILSRGNRPATKNLHRSEFAQLRDIQIGHRLPHLEERYLIGKNEGEIALDCRIFSERPETHWTQSERMQLLKIELR